MVATFIDSFLAPTFFADRPGLYWMPFQLRQLSLPRMTKTPPPPSTYFFRSSRESTSGIGAYTGCGPYPGPASTSDRRQHSFPSLTVSERIYLLATLNWSNSTLNGMTEVFTAATPICTLLG